MNVIVSIRLQAESEEEMQTMAGAVLEVRRHYGDLREAGLLGPKERTQVRILAITDHYMEPVIEGEVIANVPTSPVVLDDSAENQVPVVP